MKKFKEWINSPILPVWLCQSMSHGSYCQLDWFRIGIAYLLIMIAVFGEDFIRLLT